MARIMRLEETAAEGTRSYQVKNKSISKYFSIFTQTLFDLNRDEEPEPAQQAPAPSQPAALPPKQPKVVEHDLGEEVQDVPMPPPPKPMEPKESAPPVHGDNIVVRSDYDPKSKRFTKVRALWA